MSAETRQTHDVITLGHQEFQEFRRFMSRRLDEISAEIGANTQLLDMAENGIARKFAEVLSILGAINYQGSGASAHNVGIELSAVVKTSEDAANRILDSAEKISALTAVSWDDPAARTEKLAQIARHTQDILAACAFQDLTGQRVARTLENIRRAQAELADTLKRLGLKIDMPETELQVTVDANAAQSQDDIDKLF